MARWKQTGRRRESERRGRGEEGSWREMEKEEERTKKRRKRRSGIAPSPEASSQNLLSGLISDLTAKFLLKLTPC